ncbi:MAG: hypothetical protein CME65_12845 [Halobacteriovoraceae bacterium]|nr:hypothetical protein [Halobacteriovoraceae bacterium]
MTLKWSIFTIFLIFMSSAMAQSRYVDGLQKVTFRTGPGTDNKIIRMIETNEKVTLIEAGEKWTKVKDGEGNEGYILNRFVTKETPYIYRYQYQKSLNEKLKDKEKDLSAQVKDLRAELAQIKSELSTTKENLQSTEQNFTQLQEGASDYIGLKKKYDSTVAQLKQAKVRTEKLEEQVNTHYIKWFLAGGSVLFVGWLIGLISRKKKYSSRIKL